MGGVNSVLVLKMTGRGSPGLRGRGGIRGRGILSLSLFINYIT